MSVETYIEQLAAEHAHEQENAFAWLLAHPAESRPRLTALAQAGRPIQPALGAIHLLGRMGVASDVALLADILRRADPQLFWGSAQALAHHAAPPALHALLHALSHENGDVVGAAAIALGMRGDEAARPPLEALLEHKDKPVRYRAVLALRQLDAAPSQEVLRKHRVQEGSAEIRRLIDEIEIELDNG